MPDHEVLFGRLKLQLQEQITPHVVQLSSKDCNSGWCLLHLRQFYLQSCSNVGREHSQYGQYGKKHPVAGL